MHGCLRGAARHLHGACRAQGMHVPCAARLFLATAPRLLLIILLLDIRLDVCPLWCMTDKRLCCLLVLACHFLKAPSTHSILCCACPIRLQQHRSNKTPNLVRKANLRALCSLLCACPVAGTKPLCRHPNPVPKERTWGGLEATPVAIDKNLGWLLEPITCTPPSWQPYNRRCTWKPGSMPRFSWVALLPPLPL